MLAFVHLHKTAGTTMNSILRRSFGFHHCDVHPWKEKFSVFQAEDFVRLKRIYSRIESISGHQIRAYSNLKQVWPRTRYLTFLREPLARTASYYQYEIQYNKYNVSLEEWLNWTDRKNYQTTVIAGKPDLDAAIKLLESKFIFVGLVERFDESLVMLRKTTGDRLNINYSEKNRAPNDSIKKRILSDPETLTQLKKANELDLELYEYVKEKIYRKYQDEYGPTLEKDVTDFQNSNNPFQGSVKLMLHFLKRRIIYTPILYGYRYWCFR